MLFGFQTRHDEARTYTELAVYILATLGRYTRATTLEVENNKYPRIFCSNSQRVEVIIVGKA